MSNADKITTSQLSSYYTENAERVLSLPFLKSMIHNSTSSGGVYGSYSPSATVDGTMLWNPVSWYESYPWMSPTYIQYSGIDLVRVLEEINKLVANTPNKLPNALVSNNCPPSNIYIDLEKRWHCDIALAGCPKESVHIFFDDNYFEIVYIQPASEVEENIAYIQKGIKPLNEKLRIFLDPHRWSALTLQREYKNGLLSLICDPIKEPKPTMEFKITETED